MDTRSHLSSDDASTHAHRQLIGYIGLLLSPGLVLFAALRPMPRLQAWPPLSSVSAYYYSAGVVAFVGTLVALAVFFFTYRGYRNRHQWKDRMLATVAGFAALGVALFPTTAPDTIYALPWWTPTMRTMHYASAGTLFACFFLFSVWLFPKTSEEAKGEPLARDKRVRNAIYYVCGVVMLVAIGWILWAARTGRPIFWPEAVALTAFAVSWLTKGRALRSIAAGIEQLRPGASATQARASGAARP